MATISYSLSEKSDKVSGKSEILMRLSFGRGKVYRCGSGIRIMPGWWDKRRQTVKPPIMSGPDRNQAMKAKETLEKLSSFIIDGMSNPEKQTKENLTSLKESFFHPRQTSGKAFVADLMDGYCKTHALSDVRKRNIMVMKRVLDRFDEKRGIRLAIDDTTPDDLRALEKFLSAESMSDNTVMMRGNNTVTCKMKILRAVFHDAEKQGMNTGNPFMKYQMPKETYGTPYYLTKEERDRIADYDLAHRPSLAAQRDIFIFQCLTGCRIGDLIRLLPSNVISSADGGYILEYIPHKTGAKRPDALRVPLSDEAVAIIERHKDEDRDGRILPFISAQKYNDALKAIFKIAGIDRPVTVLDPLSGKERQVRLCDVASSHLARRTFIGNLYKAIKDPNIIGSMSGHVEGSKAFSRYRTIDDDIRRDAIRHLLRDE